MASSRDGTARFLFSHVSGTITIPSSMKSSMRLLSSSGMSTSRLEASAKGIGSSKYDGGGKFIVCGEFISVGFHSSQCRMSFAKSVHNSDATHHSFGQGEPPKVSLRLIRPICSHIIAHLAAVSPLSDILQYADLISDFPPNISLLGGGT
jgi:hypothetical protein